MKRLALVALLLVACDAPKPAVEAASGSSVEATKSAPVNTELLVAAPSSALLNEVLTFRPKTKHHFELKAPQKCGSFEFEKMSPRALKCQFTASGKHEVVLSVCNDAKEYCKRVTFQVQVVGNVGLAMIGDDGGQKVQQPTQEHEPVAGFLINKPNEAKARASSGDKLIFIHFYGIWCPPCNLLEENVYTEPEFLKSTDGMVRLMLDADSDISWDWKDRFKVRGYPTVIIANSNLEEITRVVGYRSTEVMSEWALEAIEQRRTSVTVLRAKFPSPEGANDATRARIGRWHYERGEWEKAATWLANHPASESQLFALLAAQRVAADNGESDEEAKISRELTQKFPDDIRFASWVLSLKPKDAADPLIGAALKNLERWGAAQDLDQTGYSMADVAWLRASIYGAIQNEKMEKAGYLDAAAHYEKSAKSSNKEVARGANMERAYALHKAGENTQAKALYEELADAYPNEFSFNYDFAYVLKELEEYERAYDYAKRAEAHAYGDNWLRAIKLKATLELRMGERDQAAKTVESALAEVTIPRSTALRTHRYVAALRSLALEISSDPEPMPKTP